VGDELTLLSFSPSCFWSGAVGYNSVLLNVAVYVNFGAFVEHRFSTMRFIVMKIFYKQNGVKDVS